MTRRLRGPTPWPEHWRRECPGPRSWIVEDHELYMRSVWMMRCPKTPDGPEMRMGMNLPDMIPPLAEHLAECAGIPVVPALPIIPASAYRFTFDQPMFTRVGDEWHLIGPDWSLPVGEVVTVERHRSGVGAAPSRVKVGEYVAVRTVRHRPDSPTGRARGTTSTRYVIARIDSGGTT